MAVPQDLLDILVCPVCKTPVKLVERRKKSQEDINREPQGQTQNKEQVLQGLKCSTCRRVYPIRDDIPVMLVDEARVDPS